MALNLAVPLSANELFDDNDLIFPSMSRDNLKILVSPGSESSGVSSLDAEEAKKLVAEQLTTEIIAPEAITVQTLLETLRQLSDDSLNPDDVEDIEEEPQEITKDAETKPKTDKPSLDNVAIIYNGRNILDFEANTKQSWNVQYTHLPEKNLQMYLANRSQYDRLADKTTREYSLDRCHQCQFPYPVKLKEFNVKPIDGAVEMNKNVQLFGSNNNNTNTNTNTNTTTNNNNNNNNMNNAFNQYNQFAQYSHQNASPRTPSAFYGSANNSTNFNYGATNNNSNSNNNNTKTATMNGFNGINNNFNNLTNLNNVGAAALAGISLAGLTNNPNNALKSNMNFSHNNINNINANINHGSNNNTNNKYHAFNRQIYNNNNLANKMPYKMYSHF